MSDNISLIQLPLDVLLNILSRLKLNDIRNVMLTCKHMRNLIVNESTLWRQICQNKLILASNESQIKYLTWYNRCRISHNWSKGIYKSKVIIQHKTNYMPWLQFKNSQELYLSVGSELRCYALDKKGLPKSNLLWSIEVPTVKRSDVRTNDVSRFIVKDEMIVCGNRDGCTAVYRINNHKHRPNLHIYIEDCHENGFVEVSAVEKIKNTIVTASNDSSVICFWHWKNAEMDSNKQSYTSLDSKKEIELPKKCGCRCVAANKMEDKLAIGLNGNSKPLLIDVNTGDILMASDITRNTKEVVRDILWHNEYCIAYVTYSGRLRLIDTRSASMIYETMDPFNSSLYCLKTDNDRAIVVGSSEYSRCVLFDLRSTHHIQMFFTQKKSSPVYSLDFDSTKLIAAADRGVAVMNFNVNAATTQPRDYSHTFELIC